MPALRLRLRTTCVTCGNPIPMTAATLDVVCPTCDAPRRLAPEAFSWIVAAGPKSIMATRVHATNGEGAVVLGEGDSAAVACGACGATIDEEAIAAALASFGLTCRCGRWVAVRPVPETIDGERWWTAFVGESEVAPVAPATAPVHFPCPNCGGGLLVDGTTRTPDCRHCGKHSYLPDDLWRALRPTPKAEPFYLWVDPTWYASWTQQRGAQARAVLVAVVLVVLGMAVLFALENPQRGVTDAAFLSLSLSWMVAGPSAPSWRAGGDRSAPGSQGPARRTRRYAAARNDALR